MLARIRKAMDEKDQGFTLVELLVVMIIIGILAAVAIPVFLNQREKARDTSTKADVSTVGKEIATYYVDGTADIAASQDATTTDIILTAGTETITEIEVSDGTTLSGAVTNIGTATGAKLSENWCVALTNTSGDKQTFHYSAQGGLDEGACA